MHKLLFHIGYHKTASTLFQRRIFPSHPEIHLADRTQARDLLLSQRTLSFDVTRVLRWLEHERKIAGPNRWIVVSNEELSGNIHTGGGGGFVSPVIAERIHRVAPDASIAIFIRRQQDLAESAYRQYIREGGSSRLEPYLFEAKDWPYRFPDFSLEFLRFDQLVEHYQALFPGRVFVYPYEWFRQDATAFTHAFLSTTMGLTEIPQAVLEATQDRHNLGLSAPALRFLRLVNRTGIYPLGAPRGKRRTRVHRALVARLRMLDRALASLGHPLSRNVVPAHTKSAIESRFADSNARLEKLIGADLRQWGYAVASNPPGEDIRVLNSGHLAGHHGRPR